MKALIWLLTWICKIAITCPRLVLAVFVGLAVTGFYLLPSVKVSTNLVAGVGDVSPVINLTVENSALFGEQDSLIVVLEFPEPPGEMRRVIIEGVGKSLSTLPNVRRVVYRFLDPDNEKQITRLFKHFLRGMNEQERESIKAIFTSQGMANALSRNRNRLFMVQNPDLSNRILEDPLELGQFVSQSINKRVGNVSLGDAYLFIASPDSTMYLIQITPAIASADIGKSRILLNRLNKRISKRLKEIIQTIPDGPKRFKDLKWHGVSP